MQVRSRLPDSRAQSPFRTCTRGNSTSAASSLCPERRVPGTGREISREAQSLAGERVGQRRSGRGRVARLRSRSRSGRPCTLGRSGDEALAARFAGHCRRASRRRRVARLHPGPRHPHQSRQPGDRRPRARDHARGCRTPGSGDHRDAADGRIAARACAFSRSWRHQHRFPSRAAVDRASAGSAGCRRARSVQEGDRGRRRGHHDRAHPGPGNRRERRERCRPRS